MRDDPTIDERTAWEHAEQERLARELAHEICECPHTVARMIMDRCDTPAEARKAAEDVIEWATGVEVEAVFRDA